MYLLLGCVWSVLMLRLLTRLRNDLSCVEWDVKKINHLLTLAMVLTHSTAKNRWKMPLDYRDRARHHSARTGHCSGSRGCLSRCPVDFEESATTTIKSQLHGSRRSRPRNVIQRWRIGFDEHRSLRRVLPPQPARSLDDIGLKLPICTASSRWTW